ncbi:glycosyltransferase family 4 protein [Bradyrhizobium sp. SYSU BS000235]|uniref:glycosyltransferase family 4 protein n=1 Tax=Bradyrhizobium sp. SYSU BS000235 TaxID=3411332 RepID=UPI003C78EA35
MNLMQSPSNINRRRRILLVQTQAENAGAQEISRLVGAGLTARGYEVHNLFFYRKSSHFDEQPNTTYCAPNRPGSPFAFLRFLHRLGQLVRSRDWDAILTFQHYGNVIGGGISRLVSPAPIIANQVSSRITMNRLVLTADKILGSLGFYTYITVNSHDLQREYSNYPNSYLKRVNYVAHGFDQKTADISQFDARQAFNLPQEVTLLGSVSRLNPTKRLDAAIRLLPKRPDWHLALAGQGPDEERLRQLAKQIGVSDRVHFIGELSPNAIGAFLAGLDVFVFPTQGETFGLAAVEAASAGIPTVAADLPVLREVLSYEGKPAALFADAADDAKFLSAVSEIVENQELRAELQANANGLASRYSVDTMINEYVRLLDSASQPQRDKAVA